MSIAAQTEKIPPLPRLRGGCLLPESLEVKNLHTTVGSVNIYDGLTGDGDEVFILEGGRPFSDFRNKYAHIFPAPLSEFQAGERFYRVAVVPSSRFYPDLSIPCNEETVINLISGMIEICGYLHGQGFALDDLDARTLYYEDDHWKFLVQPAQQPSELTLDLWMRRFVRGLLCQKLEPGNTRDLEQPLKGLCFSVEVSAPLMAFLDGEMDADSLYARLDVIREMPSPQWEVAGLTHPGLERARNEDAFGQMSFISFSAFRRVNVQLAAVSDGMGGHSLGDRASDQALLTWFRNTMSRVNIMPSRPAPVICSWLEETLDNVQNSLNELARMIPVVGRGKPGATFTGGILIERNLYLLNCGDSRTYRLGPNGLERLTRDHSLVQKFIDQGDLSEAEAFGHQQSNIITSYLGIEPQQFKYDRYIHHIGQGQRLLLCSDGLTDMVTEREIEKILGQSPSAEAAAQCLVEAACQQGGKDNITALVLFDKASAPQPNPQTSTPANKEEHQE